MGTRRLLAATLREGVAAVSELQVADQGRAHQTLEQGWWVVAGSCFFFKVENNVSLRICSYCFPTRPLSKAGGYAWAPVRYPAGGGGGSKQTPSGTLVGRAHQALEQGWWVVVGSCEFGTPFASGYRLRRRATRSHGIAVTSSSPRTVRRRHTNQWDTFAAVLKNILASSTRIFARCFCMRTRSSKMNTSSPGVIAGRQHAITAEGALGAGAACVPV